MSHLKRARPSRISSSPHRLKLFFLPICSRGVYRIPSLPSPSSAAFCPLYFEDVHAAHFVPRNDGPVSCDHAGRSVARKKLWIVNGRLKCFRDCQDRFSIACENTEPLRQVAGCAVYSSLSLSPEC
jgi:hypothetical protein